MERAHRATTRLTGAGTFLLGVVMIVVTLARGGGPLAIGVVTGLAFAAVGGLRYAHATRTDAP